MADPYQEKRIKRMARVDDLSPDLRALVHEYGLTVVDSFMACGVSKAKHIRHLINTVHQGSVEIGNRSSNPLLMQRLSLATASTPTTPPDGEGE